MRDSALGRVTELMDGGLYAQAAFELNSVSLSIQDKDHAAVIRGELLERLGHFADARRTLEATLQTKRLNAVQLSTCELTLGRIDWEEGATESAISRIQKAVSLSKQAADVRRKCWAQATLAILIADVSGPAAVTSLLSECRQDAIKLGDGRVWAFLHAASAVIEARRGLFRSAISHIRCCRDLIAQAPNPWLESYIEFTSTNIAIFQSDYERALAHATRAVQLAELAGVAASLRTSYSSLGFVHYSIGNYDEAIRQFRRALGTFAFGGDARRGIVDSIARIRLAQGSLDECAALLSEIENAIETPADRILYSSRHATLTRSRLYSRQGLHTEALRQTEHSLRLAEQASDHFLLVSSLLEKAHILQQMGRISEAIEVLQTVLAKLPPESPELYAQYELILACALAAGGQFEIGTIHRQRAHRIFSGLRSEPALRELDHYWRFANSRGNPHVAEPIPLEVETRRLTGSTSIQSISALLAHSGRPELLASALVEVFEVSNAVHAVVATTDDHVLASMGSIESDSRLQRVFVHTCRGNEIEVLIEPKTDVESAATINSLLSILTVIQELERARRDREERLMLWPTEDLPVMNEHAVINGNMRELMTTARKVAPTHISVLLTGESGTGKEILARAIHTFSDRAERAFIPFNCAAVPHDMLESQLFGHRRGAFTGADRDNPGVIRSARAGTLFLDEIGELSAELQPKLLRFLESGEILPLGETTPFTVNVRIIAATNAKLEEAVKSGRFREDLFYRLNVVRLQIPPLRERRDELPALIQHFVSKAAIEFRKGQIRIAENTMERLLLAPWPGNIRQLQNELRRMIALADADAVLTPDALSSEVAGEIASDSEAVIPHFTGKLYPALERVEREMIKAALQQHRGKMDAAAKSLGISRKGLYLKRQRLGL